MTSILSISFYSRAGDEAKNVARAAEMIRGFAKRTKVDLVMLPELFTCGYVGRALPSWQEDTSSATFQTFEALSREIDAIVCWGFPEKGDGCKVYNSYAVQEPGREPALVRKTHLHISTPGTGSNEPEFLLPGDRLGLVDTRMGRLGVMIGYDGMFPEVPRCLVLQGADVILWPSRSDGSIAAGGHPVVRAIDNVIPVVMVDGWQWKGLWLRSWTQIVSYEGEVLAQSKNEESLLHVKLDFKEARDFRRASVDALAAYRVRRPELYGPITASPGVQHAF